MILMDETKLNTFLLVNKERSFTKASEKLFLSPIAVKKQIDSLEDEVGEKLFIRRPTGVIPTPAGTVFEKHARKILDEIENTKRDIVNTAISNRGEILAGHNIVFNYKFIGSLSTGFSENHNCIIQFQRYQRDELYDLLASKQINCVFCEKTLFENKNTNGMKFYPLVSMNVYTIMNKNHYLSDRKQMNIEDLKDQELYITNALGQKTISALQESTSGRIRFIEETDRNTLFNRIIKGAVEIYPRSFSYYSCIPLNIEPINLGIYTLNNQPEILTDMIRFTKDFVNNHDTNFEEIM